MKWHNLAQSRTISGRRVGRGIGSGAGKTSGRGTKGQRSRSGGSLRPGFEGGQNPLSQRLPKQRGFTSMGPRVQVIHTDQLNVFKDKAVVGFEALKAAGLISTTQQPVKLLLRGKLDKAVKLQISGASKPAVEAILAAGGNFSKVGLPKARQPKVSGQGDGPQTS